MSSQPEVVLSPCVGICALDENDVCIGCFRTGREISDWGDLNNEKKREVLRACGKRMNGDNTLSTN